MIRHLLATTAIATLLSTAAYAQDTTAPAPATPAPATQEASPAQAPMTDGHLATNIIGESVFNSTGNDAVSIGEVNDIVIGANGEIESVVIGVGGFLGIGEKNVALKYSEVDWAEKDGDRWLLVPTTKEQLEAQAEFDRRGYDPAPAAVSATEPAPATDTTATAPAPSTETDTTATAPAAPADDSTAAAPAAPADDKTAAAPSDSTATGTDPTATAAIDKSALTEVPAGELRSEDLIGTTVYGADDQNIGEIGDVVMSQDGKVDAIIIDVGGFLGVGEKEVAVGMDNLAFMADKDGNKYLYTAFSKEQLDAQPTYDKSTYTEKRDEQRMMMSQ